MAIESLCQKCGARLRVGDEHAGKLARCPQCQAVYTVPSPSGATLQTSQTAQAGERWRMKSPDGTVYGPVPREDLDRWLAEGRVTAESQLVRDGGNQWQWAGEIYPQLRSSAPKAGAGNAPFAPYQPTSPFSGTTTGALSNQPGGANPFAEGAVSSNPYASPTAGYFNPGMAASYQPHHGVMVLVFGILSFAICALFGIPALIMGNNDLRAMSAGRMDPSGRGLVIAGMVLGGITLTFTVIVMIFYFVVIVAAIANS